tara:strand:- start:132 stop:1139 length:1008 start_codon:yes stop_codon:yes gene_type:complete
MCTRFLIALLLISGCGLLIGEKEEQEMFENPVFTEVYFTTDYESDERPDRGLIAINYNNPKEFIVLERGESSFSPVSLSPDRKKLIYGDHTLTGSDPQLVIYDLDSKTKEPLYFDEGKLRLLTSKSSNIVWDKSGDSFYTSSPTSWGIINTYLYSLERMAIDFETSNVASIYPYDLISKDTLLIFTNEFFSWEHGVVNPYLMDKEGNYIKKVENPYLRSINEGGLIKRVVRNLAWSDSLRLIVGSYSNSEEFEGSKIIITDLDGNVYKEFTDGKYRNRAPVWTKDGKIIFTESRVKNSDVLYAGLKILDPETGKISPFFSRYNYPELIGVGTAAL